MNFTYLAAQTFGDDTLEEELLVLFLAQAHRLIPVIAASGVKAKNDAAHLLRGSAHAIGAEEVAAAAAACQTGDPDDRAGETAAMGALLAAFAATEAAIKTHLASRRSRAP